MSANTISPDEAGLLIHRFVTETIPILAWFVSANQSVKMKVRGFVTGFTRDVGMGISTESPALNRDTSLPAYMLFAHDSIVEATFEYSDETEVPDTLEVGSGLRIRFDNGDILIILEIRNKSL